MKNIAIINTCNYGSTGKIALNLYEYLKINGYNTIFCYGRGNQSSDANHIKISSNLEVGIHAFLQKYIGLHSFVSIFSTIKLFKLLEAKKIDTIYCINLHGYYINEPWFYNYLASNKFKVIYIMADESAYLGDCGYHGNCNNYLHGCGNCPKKQLVLDFSSHLFKKKKRAYTKMTNMIFVGPEYTIKEAQKSPLLYNKKTAIVDEAINIDFYTPKNTDNLFNSLGIDKTKKIIVCVAPSSYKRKGCQYYLELARRFEKNSNYIFIHIGYEGDIKKCPNNYIPIKYISNQELLAEYYSIADLFVFPSLLDTMPNACLEALSCGTPILGFNISGMPYIANKDTGTFVEACNVSELEKVVKNINKKTTTTINTCRNYAKSRYDQKQYCQKLMKLGMEL